MNTLVIGSMCNYQPKDVACWINSLRATGYSRDVTILDFGGCSIDTLYYLTDRGVTVLKADLDGHHIVVQRFLAMYGYLQGKEKDYSSVLATDIKDIVFQKDPFDYINTAIKMDVEKPVIVSSENILYKDEDWGKNNMAVCYPHLADQMMDKVIYNAGVIGGYLPDTRDFFLHIYHLSLLGEVNDPQPDQAAMNILLNTAPFIYTTKMTNEKQGQLSINMGTSWADNATKYRDKLIDGYSEDISQFSIIHQWDRVSSLRPMIQKKFGILVD